MLESEWVAACHRGSNRIPIWTEVNEGNEGGEEKTLDGQPIESKDNGPVVKIHCVSLLTLSSRRLAAAPRRALADNAAPT